MREPTCPSCGNRVSFGENACFTCGYRLAATCRLCGSTRITVRKRFTRWGWQALIGGILLLPFGVGLILILASTGLVWRQVACRGCGERYSID